MKTRTKVIGSLIAATALGAAFYNASDDTVVTQGSSPIPTKFDGDACWRTFNNRQETIERQLDAALRASAGSPEATSRALADANAGTIAATNDRIECGLRSFDRS